MNAAPFHSTCIHRPSPVFLLVFMVAVRQFLNSGRRPFKLFASLYLFIVSYFNLVPPYRRAGVSALTLRHTHPSCSQVKLNMGLFAKSPQKDAYTLDKQLFSCKTHKRPAKYIARAVFRQTTSCLNIIQFAPFKSSHSMSHQLK